MNFLSRVGVIKHIKAAELGDAEAQFNLAVRYEYGRVVLQDSQAAVMWYTKAAEQGYAKLISLCLYFVGVEYVLRPQKDTGRPVA